jgi:hypothetical protein
MAKAEPAKPDMHSSQYIILTPVEQMYDDGILFEGADDKAKMLNQTDFIRLRDHYQHIAGGATKDLEDTFVRSLKACIKIPE